MLCHVESFVVLMSYPCSILRFYIYDNCIFIYLQILDFEVYKNLRSINDTITDIDRFVYEYRFCEANSS